MDLLSSTYRMTTFHIGVACNPALLFIDDSVNNPETEKHVINDE
jgi:hypothetical protein